MSKEKSEAIKAFALSQAQMGAAIKNSKNPFLKNTYADLTAIQNAVYPAFHSNGFAIVQTPSKDALGSYVETSFIHNSGEVFSGRVYLEYKANDMQSLGGAITYARRYGLAAISGVPVEDDDGNAATGRGNSKAHQKPLNQAPMTPPKQPQGTPTQRGVRFMKFIETADSELLASQLTNAFDLIEEIRQEDADFATKMENSLETRQLELGML
jgi:hypothetical protein